MHTHLHGNNEIACFGTTTYEALNRRTNCCCCCRCRCFHGTACVCFSYGSSSAKCTTTYTQKTRDFLSSHFAVASYSTLACVFRAILPIYASNFYTGRERDLQRHNDFCCFVVVMCTLLKMCEYVSMIVFVFVCVYVCLYFRCSFLLSFHVDVCACVCFGERTLLKLS